MDVLATRLTWKDNIYGANHLEAACFVQVPNQSVEKFVSLTLVFAHQGWQLISCENDFKNVLVLHSSGSNMGKFFKKQSVITARKLYSCCSILWLLNSRGQLPLMQGPQDNILRQWTAHLDLGLSLSLGLMSPSLWIQALPVNLAMCNQCLLRLALNMTVVMKVG